MTTRALFFALLLLSGCADTGVTTKVRNASGAVIMETGANANTLDYRGPDGSSFHATGLDHASPILANGAGTALIIDATGRVIGVISAGVVGGLLAVPHPGTAAVAATLPAVTSHVQGIVSPPANMQIHQQWTQAHGTPSPTPHHHRRHVPNSSPPKD